MNERQREHAKRMLAHAEGAMSVADAADATEQLDVPLGETADWVLIQAAAVAGLRLQIAQELEGIGIDRRAGAVARVEAREQRLVNLYRAVERARAWRPIAGQIPTRRVP